MMAILSWTFGGLGGLCLVMGIVTILDIIPKYQEIPELAKLTWVFWLAVSAIFLLISIAFALGYWNSGEKERE